MWPLTQLPLHRHKIEVETGRRTQPPSPPFKKLIGPCYYLRKKVRRVYKGSAWLTLFGRGLTASPRNYVKSSG